MASLIPFEGFPEPGKICIFDPSGVLIACDKFENYIFNNSDAEELTTSTSYISKPTPISITMPALDSGVKYCVFYSCEFSSNSNGGGTAVQLVEGATVHAEIQRTSGNANAFTVFSGVIPLTSAGSARTLELKFKALDHTASIRRARLIGWRLN